MTTLVVLQPGYLPWLGYFDLLNKADVFVHYDDVQFDKHGWRNRNRVKGPKGAIWLTVPVLHSGRMGQLILDVDSFRSPPTPSSASHKANALRSLLTQGRRMPVARLDQINACYHWRFSTVCCSNAYGLARLRASQDALVGRRGTR
jgi:WbqC-like protein family